MFDSGLIQIFERGLLGLGGCSFFTDCLIQNVLLLQPCSLATIL